jgi:hypothetical protein
MNKHVISDEAFDFIQQSLTEGKHWLAYNTEPYYLEIPDVVMFYSKDEAKQFASDNISDVDCYRVLPVASIADVMRNVPYGEEPGGHITDPDANGLFNKEGNGFTDALIDQIEQNQFIHSNKTTIMNQKNFEYLDKQIFYTGFGQGHGETLKEKMMEGKPEFVLSHQQDFGKDNTAATLQFRKSNEGDMYFLNSYNLMLKNAQHTEPIKQTFYVNNDMRRKEQEDITLKEGYNLLSGRAVNKNLVSKEGEKYNAWVQLDFKTMDKHGNYEEKKFHQNYGFDLEKVLAKHPIKELGDQTDRERLVDSLQRGNRQSVTLQLEGKEQKIFIEAAPQYKGLNFYDNNMKRINAQELYAGKGEGQGEQKKEGKQEGKSAAVKQEAGSGSEEEGGGGKSSQKRSKRKSQGQGIS